MSERSVQKLNFSETPKSLHTPARQADPPTSPPSPEHTVAPTPTNVGKRAPMDRAQIRAASDRIAELIQWPGGEAKARREMRQTYGWSNYRTNRLIKVILASWHSVDEEARKYDKQKAVRRLQTHIEALRADKNVTAAKYAIIAQLEGQLAKIQGTEAPLVTRVEYDLGPAIANVLKGLDASQMKSMVAEYDQLQKQANKVKQLSSSSSVPIVDGELVDDKESK